MDRDDETFNIVYIPGGGGGHSTFMWTGGGLPLGVETSG